jgi:hypothetical protein
MRVPVQEPAMLTAVGKLQGSARSPPRIGMGGGGGVVSGAGASASAAVCQARVAREEESNTRARAERMRVDTVGGRGVQSVRDVPEQWLTQDLVSKPKATRRSNLRCGTARGHPP